ncbi:MAG: YtxH domain-containing protein [Bacteroidetes bacterium]|jgi:gas vesicle protein|nr:YtxH domain-containing protein [Bacteroidota bacterium]
MKEYTAKDLLQTALWAGAVGSISGFILGLLVAPFEGEKMRRSISYRLEQWGGDVVRLSDRLQPPGTTTEGRGTSEALVADAEERAERIRADIDAILGRMREREASSS